MTPLTDLLQQGPAHAWLFVPSAILLGALHGLEPGHSKTMMAAFVIAVRGTVAQAVLLGLAATLSHTAVVWAIALGGQILGRHYAGEAVEPYFQLASAAAIIGIALWMAGRTWHERHHDHGHHHAHHPPAGVGTGAAALAEHDHPDLGGGDDAHARAHASDIRRRFAGRPVTTGQIVLFGLTGGLVPCPAAITVLLLCIQLKQVSLGVALVVCFSIGLALTMVSAGVLAALGIRHVAPRWSGFGAFARRAPYASAGLIVLVGLYTGWLGWQGLRQEATPRAADASGLFRSEGSR